MCSRANDFTRTLGDVSRTLRGMGLHHTVQVRSPCKAHAVHCQLGLCVVCVGWRGAAPQHQRCRTAWGWVVRHVQSASAPAELSPSGPPVQAPVEDDLVHVDIALPDYKASRAACSWGLAPAGSVRQGSTRQACRTQSKKCSRACSVAAPSPP